MTTVAVILSGCGYLDGAEIREAVLSLLYLDQGGADVQCFAPDINQMHVVNHLTGEPAVNTQRNVLEEAARIARGNVKPLSQLDASQFNALVIPGGYGVAKNLSSLATEGADCHVLPECAQAILSFMEQKKPIGAICIAPAVLAAAVKGTYSPTLTIGEDEGTAAAITAFGCTHQNCETDAMVYDPETRIASCSAYMREDSLARVAKGIEQTIHTVLKEARTIQHAA